MTLATTTLTVSTPECTGRTRQCEPATVGVPLPRGLVTDADRLSLTDENDQLVPLQTIPTDRWSDGSLRWALLDFQITGEPAPRREFTLHVGREPSGDRVRGVMVTESATDISIDTGAARFVLSTGAPFPFAEVSVGGHDQIDRGQSRLYVTDRRGERFSAQIQSIAVETLGSLRTTVRLEGIVGRTRHPLLIVIARLQFFAGSAGVRVAITLRNSRRARHPGGYWELGDRGSAFLQDVSLQLHGIGEAQSEWSPEIDRSVETFRGPVELYQDSSGGEQWQHRNHVNREDRVPCSFRGYRFVSGEQRTMGLRATPAVQLRQQNGSVGIAVEQFWQHCPKAIETDTRALTYRMFPRQYDDLHELQGGEQKTHRLTLMFGSHDGCDDAWFWGRTPCLISASPSWYCSTEAMPYLAGSSDGSSLGYERLIAAAVEGPDSLIEKRERVDEYGWRHFGDLYADHENAFSREPAPIVSHYNNQYDAVAGFATQFMRSANHRWWELMNDLARHVVDIDIYHTDDDKAAYNHALFWHTAHYVDAGRSTHRSYPRKPTVGGGGPSNEHNYATGLMLHYFLTGDPASRECAIGLARWAIAMDDGRKTVFRWLAGTATGLASQTSSPDYHGPGRGAGHTLRALLDGHRLTGEPAFLDKADEIIRRVIHPLDDVAARNLLDAERRWSYTAFLQALGAYLDYKAERNQIDGMYRYARASLLRYAYWMAEHEYPYLDKPEILEYPTETWAAQDLRKSDVFYLASLHAKEADCSRLRERGAFFFNTAVETLSALDSRTLTRPIVLLLTNGRLHDYLHSHPQQRAVEIEDEAGIVPPSAPFVPQKARAKGRLIGVAAAIAVAALLPLLAKLVN